MRDSLLAVKAQGFRAFKNWLGPFGRKNAAMDEAIVEAAREAIGPDCRLMVDAGGSDAYWSNCYKWALRTAQMLANYDVHWFEEPLQPDALEDFVLLREHSPINLRVVRYLHAGNRFSHGSKRGPLILFSPM